MVDIDSLLAPITDGSPSGVYLKLDRSAYRALRNSYNAAQSSFRQLVETPDASSDEALLESNDENWTQLRTATFHALTQSSKDLELLGWYITSQLFTDAPYRNLADATQVLLSTVEQFWDSLNPFLPEDKLKSAEESGIARERAEFRMKPLLQLVGETHDTTAVYMPLQLIGLIDDITFADYLRAERNGSLGEIKTKAQNLFSADTQDILMDLAQTYQNLDAIEQAIAKHCQPINATPVSFKFIKENIAELINAIRYLTEDNFSKWPLDEKFRLLKDEQQAAELELPSVSAAEPTDNILESVDQSTGQASKETSQAPSVSIDAQVHNRDHAFHELRKLADYFKQTEPHSPVPFLLERAIRWGYLSLPELLQEMTGGNSQVLDHINQLTGMDNLEQTILKKIPEPQSVPESVPTVPPATEVQTASNEESQSATSIEPTTSEQSDTPNTTNQPEVKTTQSSSGITDFEW
ncbi:type VI secretion system ImpA family N-terminal domain-containing protein [Vibrio campbellii]|uniref:type VI secretion system protein TssA n=1 Tax=Vibrio campbellii TaxID=680 RepID=UPI00215CCB17|nr:type VI secretion system ImpA family N-terminal domain-containing protein [Vibrio campbellii]MCR9910787.1 type VI secretion system ImpA family N-terminal domain-containing protein [Vibrio campbellii]